MESLERWSSYAPSQAPKTWFWINAICLTYSLLLGLVLALVEDENGPKEWLFAKHAYLVYDWVLCLIWVVEIGLAVLDFLKTKSRTLPSNDVLLSPAASPSESGVRSIPEIFRTIPWYMSLELLVAVYFCASSIYFLLIRDWDSKDYEGDGGALDMVLDVMVNIVAYLYVSVDLWKQILKEHHAVDTDDAWADGEAGTAYGTISSIS